ncbi:CAP domain-containing protein [Cellulomonas sp. 179-A 9B4 NHS]|uniref:CAP domain-containing protein n=1 Tax=Cellulomonas sp. 179-A 9B4 NHS TaxID=3142379 RepID=UPI0039A2AA5B
MPRPSRRGLAVAVVALLLTSGCAQAPAPASTSTIDGYDDVEAYAAYVVTSTNAARADEDLPPLQVSPCAREAAERRARDLVGEPDLTHAPLDGVIRDCTPAAKAAENLSRAGAPANEVVEAWLGSPGHRDNLLDPDLTQIGVACVPDADALLCSQVFLGP